MSNWYNDGGHARIVEQHLCELRAEAARERLARQAPRRSARPVRAAGARSPGPAAYCGGRGARPPAARHSVRRASVTT